ncbi:antitoxin VapB48 [soil metagenome]
MRTTLDLDGSVLDQLRARQRREGKSLGRLASELLARALAETDDGGDLRPLSWRSRAMGARVDLDDGDEVERLLGEDR